MAELEKYRKCLPVLREINNCVNDEIIIPYEDYLVEFLATHTDKKNLDDRNYLDALNSISSISNCYEYARYLSLGMKEPFTICEGNLSALREGFFSHCWIETNDSVYDVTFVGKWPKDLYYKLLKPKNIKKVDLNEDQRLKRIKEDNVVAENKSEDPFIKYVGWYGYISNCLEGMGDIWWNYFPCDRKKAKELEEDDTIDDEESDEMISEMEEDENISLDKREKMIDEMEIPEYWENQKFNIYITKYGAFMSNISLLPGYTEKEKEEYLNHPFWREFTDAGYKLVIARSFSYPNSLAIYLENWTDPKLVRDGLIPGTIQIEYANDIIRNQNYITNKTQRMI